MKRNIAVLMVLILSAGALVINSEGEGASVPTKDTGNILYVAPENSTYFDLEDAIGQAVDGDTIYVAPGIYETGLLILTPGITVIGNNTEGEVIIGNVGDAIAGIHAPWVNVSGITFTDDQDHMGIMSLSNADNSSFSDIELIAMENGEGLNLRDSENVTFRNFTVRTNDRQAVRIIRSSNIGFHDFQFSCNTSMGGCFELDMTDVIVLEEGHMELRGGGSAIYNLAGGRMFLHDVTANYTEKFIMMETGNVSMYNMDIDPADILMDVPEPTQTVRSYFQRKVKMLVEAANGTIEPLEGGHIKISRDGNPIYATDHFNGTEDTSSSGGYFADPFTFLSWELVGGADGLRNGTNTITAWFQGNHSTELDLGIIDANTTDDIDITLTEAYNQTRTINGWITYKDGPLMGNSSVNSTVWLHGENGTDLSNMTVLNAAGYYWFSDLIIGINHTVVAIPENEVEEGGGQSGYLRTSGWVNLSFLPIVSSPLNLEFPYYEYIPPVAGSIFGYVRYKDGPKEGEFVEGAEVRLFNSTEVEMGVKTTNETGYYEFLDIPFNDVYEVQVTPPLDELGVNLEITGYLPWDFAFWHNKSTRANSSLMYYEHVEPEPPHPEVTILDADGDPVQGAQVEVTIEGATYTTKTNMFGIAVFENLDMEDFPADTEFKVSKEGYDDIEWAQGDDIPAIKESESKSSVWLLILLVLAVLAILAIAAFLIFIERDHMRTLKSEIQGDFRTGS